MADKITKIVEIEIDVKSGELKILDAELNKIIGKKAKLNDQQKAENETTSDAIGLIDKFTGGLASSAEGWFKMGKNAVKALTGIKAGLISTGIGALVVGLGLVVAYWDEIASVVNGVSSNQKDILASTEKTLLTQEKQLSATNSMESTLKLQGKTEKEIRDLKIQQTNEIITSFEVLLEQQKILKKTQTDAAERNQKISAGIIAFLSIPITTLLVAVDALTYGLAQLGIIEEATSLAEDALMGISSLLFDPLEVAKEGDAVIEETEKKLKELKNTRDGFLLQEEAEQDKRIDLTKKYLDLKLTLEQAHSLALIEDDRQRQLKAIEFELENNKRSIENSEFTEKQKAALSELYYTQWLDKKTQLSDTWSAEDEAKRIADEQKAIARQDELEGIRTQILKDGIDKEILLAMQKGDALYAQAKGDAELQIEIIKATEAEIDAIKKKYADEDAKRKKEDIQAAQELEQAKMSLAVDAFGALIALNNAFAGATEEQQRKAFQRDKALKIGQAIMSTAQAVTSVLAQTVDVTPLQVLRFGNAAVAAAMGIAQVATIAKTQFNPSGGSSSGGGMPSISAPTSGGGAPQFNTVGTSGFNQLSDSIAGQNNRPVQAYVVANNVSSAQSLERNRVQQASFP